MAVGLAGCFDATYSAESVKNNLSRSGYTVTEGEKIKFYDETDTSSLSGLQKIYFAEKGSGDDAEYSVILVFDSISNAGKLSSEKLVELREAAEGNCGANFKSNMSMGTYNNVVFTGTINAKNAAGLQ